MSTATESPMRNGVDTATLFATLDAVKGNPEIAKFQFRATNRWVSGTHNRSTIHGFYGAGQELTHRQVSTFDADHPEVLVGKDTAPTPVEFLLHALAGCVTTTFILHAMARGITIRELSTELKGEIDLQGLLGLDDSVPAGYEQITIRMTVKADCSDKELDDLLSYAQQHSPVCNTVCRPVPVMIERIKR